MANRSISDIIKALHRVKYGTGNSSSYGVGARKVPMGQTEGTYGHFDPVHPHRPTITLYPSGVNESNEGNGAVTTQGRGGIEGIPNGNPSGMGVGNNRFPNGFMPNPRGNNMYLLTLKDDSYLGIAMTYTISDTHTPHVSPFVHTFKTRRKSDDPNRNILDYNNYSS